MDEQDDDPTTKRHLAYLAELAEMGMDIARIAARAGAAQPERAMECNRTVVRLTEEVLKTMALHRKLSGEAVRAPPALLPPKAYVAPPTSGLIH